MSHTASSNPENIEKSKEITAIIERFLQVLLITQNSVEIGKDLSKLVRQIVQKGLTPEIANTYWEKQHDGHAPMIYQIHHIPVYVGQAFDRAIQKSHDSQTIFASLVDCMEQLKKLTDLLGENVWRTFFYQDRLFNYSDWHGSASMSAYKKFLEGLTLTQAHGFLNFGFEKDHWLKKDFLEPLLTQKAHGKQLETKTYFQSISTTDAIRIIRDDLDYPQKKDFPNPPDKEYLYSFVVGGPKFKDFETDALKAVTESVRSVELAKALLVRDDYKSSFERFMFTVELAVNTKDKS